MGFGHQHKDFGFESLLTHMSGFSPTLALVFHRDESQSQALCHVGSVSKECTKTVEMGNVMGYTMDRAKKNTFVI